MESVEVWKFPIQTPWVPVVVMPKMVSWEGSYLSENQAPPIAMFNLKLWNSLTL